MRVVLSDWDGVWFSSELAKALRWYLVAMHLKGDNEISKDLFERIVQKDFQTRQWLENFIKDERRAKEIEETMKFAGGTRIQFAQRVYHHFVDPQASEEEVKQEMLPLGEEIKDVLIEWFSKPLFENLKFFRELVFKFQLTYWGYQSVGLGLVTQTKSQALYQQLFKMKDSQGKSIWGEFEKFLTMVFWPYHEEKGFLNVECAGDYEERFPGAMPYLKGKEKVRAYLMLCQKMDVRPEETITFEDTTDGVFAAKSAGISCIGIQAFGNQQDLSQADLIIKGTLEPLIRFVDLFIFANPEELISILRTGL